jgi:hypothetical protein
MQGFKPSPCRYSANAKEKGVLPDPPILIFPKLIVNMPGFFAFAFKRLFVFENKITAKENKIKGSLTAYFKSPPRFFLFDKKFSICL